MIKIPHSAWNIGVRFCCIEHKYEFFKEHYPNSIYRETKRNITKRHLLNHVLLSYVPYRGLDVFSWRGLNVRSNNPVKETGNSKDK